MEVWRARAGHIGNQSTTSRAGSTRCAGFSPPSRQILIVPSGSNSTVPAPACLAARIVRATSAWVKRAAVRLMLSPAVAGLRNDGADNGLAALVDSYMLNRDFLLSTNAEPPVCFHSGAVGSNQFRGGRRQGLSGVLPLKG